ncbi:MAG TPA: hypothetical protein VE177_04565, partial [Candidatus Binatus sp.]|nr:hypothetical protein [Candidatus Binatus sp.]
MKRMLTVSMGLSLLFLVTSVRGETWKCKQNDGTEVFTNTQGVNCTPYEPASELGKSAGGEMGQPNRGDYPETAPDPQGSTQQQSTTVLPQPGIISFEQFRMLGQGLTEGQVLLKLGPPISSTTIACVLSGTEQRTRQRLGPTTQTEITQQQTAQTCPTMWTYAMPDGWIASLTFVSGYLTDITNSR